MNKWIYVIGCIVFPVFMGYGQTTKQDSVWIQQLQKDVFFLASDSLKGRFPSTEGDKIAANYICDRFKKLNLIPFYPTTYIQNFSFPYEDKLLSTQNIIAQTNTEKPCKFIITAHYDHLGLGKTHSREIFKNKIHNGADDNASGVALLLALAEKFMREENKLNFSIVFICFSGHETGLFGSKAFVGSNNKKTNQILNETKYVLNLDMVGRLDTLQNPSPLYFRIPKNDIQNSWKDENLPHSKENIKIIIKTNEIALDDSCFSELDIPSVTFSTGLHQDYHTSNDDAEKINYVGMFKVLLFLEEYMYGID